MSAVLETTLAIVRKLLYFVLEYFFVAVAWVMRFLKIRMKKWDRCRAQKRLEQACSALGKEVYSLFKQGQGNWQEDGGVNERLKAVQEAEAHVLTTDHTVQEINDDHFKKREELREKYSEKRAAVDRSRTPDDTP